MSQRRWWGPLLRFVGIVLMALTAGFTMLGAVGTTCVALFPTRWASMAPLAPFQWLYILFVVVGAAIAVMGMRATVMLVKGTDRSYRDALVALVGGIVVGAVHMFASRALRGSSMPADAVVWTTVFTLVVFLFLRLPGVWRGADFRRGHARANKAAAGTAAILLALLTLTIQYTMGPTHTFDDVNYANAFRISMTSIGALLMLLGLALFAPVGAARRVVTRIARARTMMLPG